MRNDDEKQGQPRTGLDRSNSPDGELEAIRERLRWAQESQELAVRILTLLNREVVGPDAIREILRMVKEFTRFEAVGIRLRDGDDFPYFEAQGFPAYFVEAESSLCDRTGDGEIIRDSVGNPVLECMCGNVIQGRTNPSFPFFTQGGSFWSNCTTELLATTSEQDRQSRTRNRCNGEGYESVALIPLRSDDEIIGLMQLNDSRRNCFTPDMIRLLEGIGASIGIVLERKQSEETLIRAKEELETRVEERTWELMETVVHLKQEMIDREQAEAAMRRSEELYRTLVENVGLGISLMDSDHNVIVSNAVVGEWFNKAASGFSGRKCFLEFEKSEAVCPHCPGIRAMATGQPAEAETERERPDGTRVVAHLRAFPTFGQDGVATGFIEVIEDITARREAEEASRESEERFRAFFDNDHAVILIIDPETGTIEDASPGASIFYGHSREDLKTKKIFEINVLPAERLSENLQMAKSQNRKYFDYQHCLADGEIRDVEVSSGPIVIGGRTLLFSVITDVTDRNRAVKALRESEDQYRAVFENAGIGINVVDRDLRLVQGNRALLKMLGYTDEEFRQLTLTDIIHPDDRTSTLQKVDGLMHGAIGPYRIEKRYIKKDGNFIWADLSASPIRNAGGKAAAVVGVIADITERKRAEEALRESEQRYRALFDESRDGVWWTARDGTLIEANQAFLDLFGLTKEESRHWNVVDGYRDPADRRRFRKTILREGSVEDFDLKLKKKDGTEIDCLLTATLRLNEEGEVVGYQGIIRDITERKKLEQQLLQAQKMEAIGTLAGGIAHDFNNLLTVILGYSELIISEKDERDRDYEDLKKVIHAANTAADMVQQILAFSRKTETKFWPINLNKQVPQLRKMLSRLLPRTIEVQIGLAQDLPTVNADSAQIDQILINLAVNARDAMPNGGKLTIETRAIALDDEYCSAHIEASKGLHALVIVRDTGTGIDRASSDRIFEPFYTTKKPGLGTGLGLAMVYGIVKGHGGHITVHSEPGEGTEFKIYLPAHQVETEPDVAMSAQFSALGDGTILLADDEELVRSLGERILGKRGYRILTASNGLEALEIYRQKRDEISLVILDLIMPIMDGKQCLDEILKINPLAKVLIASGYSPDGATKEILEGRAKGLVNKPYDIMQMVRSVRDALDSE